MSRKHSHWDPAETMRGGGSHRDNEGGSHRDDEGGSHRDNEGGGGS